MREVSYYAPGELGEALGLLAQHGKRATVLAGGTDLVPKINYYELKPEVLVYVGRLGLDYIRQAGGQLELGAAATLAQVAASQLLQETAPALVTAARQHSSTAIRTTATVGGNIVNASPAADLVMPLLAMDAQVRLARQGSERCVELAEFFTGPGQTVLAPDELLLDVQVPPTAGRVEFLKLGKRKAQACSIVVTAVRLQVADGVCRDARIVVGSMAPTPLRCRAAEAWLTGQQVDETVLAAAAEHAIAETSPIDDGKATAWYRREAGTALVKRALMRAAGL